MTKHSLLGVFSRTEPAYVLASTPDTSSINLQGFCDSIRANELSGWSELNNGVAQGLTIKFPGINDVRSVEEMLFLANEYGGVAEEDWVRRGVESVPKVGVVDGKIRLEGVFVGKGEMPGVKGTVRVEEGRVRFEGVMPKREGVVVEEEEKVPVEVKRAVVEDGRVKFEGVMPKREGVVAEEEKVPVEVKRAVVEDGRVKFEGVMPARKEEAVMEGVKEEGAKEEGVKIEGEKQPMEVQGPLAMVMKRVVVEDGKVKFQGVMPQPKEGVKKPEKNLVLPKQVILEDGQLKIRNLLWRGRPPKNKGEDNPIKFPEQKIVYTNEYEKNEFQSIGHMIQKEEERKEAEKTALLVKELRIAQKYTPTRSPITRPNTWTRPAIIRPDGSTVEKSAEPPKTEGDQSTPTQIQIQREWAFISKNKPLKNNNEPTKPERKFKIRRYELEPKDEPAQDVESVNPQEDNAKPQENNVKPQEDDAEKSFPPPPPPGFGPPPIRYHPVNNPAKRLVRKHYIGDP